MVQDTLPAPHNPLGLRMCLGVLSLAGAGVSPCKHWRNQDLLAVTPFTLAHGALTCPVTRVGLMMDLPHLWHSLKVSSSGQVWPRCSHAVCRRRSPLSSAGVRVPVKAAPSMFDDAARL